MNRLVCVPKNFKVREKLPRMGTLVFALAVALLTFAAPLFAQRDAKVLHRNLAELVSDSYTIVLGRVIAVRAEPHPQFNNIATVEVTLQVKEVWKGQAGQQFTFRAFVNHPLDYKEKLGYSGEQDVLLMLTKPSNIGLSSPAGLEQGRFRVQTDVSGKQMAINGLGNAGLMARVNASAPKLSGLLGNVPARQLLSSTQAGPISLDDLRVLVQTLVANPQ